MHFIIITTDNIEIFFLPLQRRHIAQHAHPWWGTSSQNGNGFTDHPLMTGTIIKNNTQQTRREA
jgi:hypothetical protein